MLVRFWGVRGSVPWATSESIGCGCNTPCLEVRDERTDALLVLDAGSGIVGLGRVLERSSGKIPIVLSHYHWDHTQGLPFFGPFFAASHQTVIWAPALAGASTEWIEQGFAAPYFPVPFDQLPGRPSISLFGPGELEIGGFTVGAHPLNHPGGAFAYRVHSESGDLVYATDHEFGDAPLDRDLARFCDGAAAMICDAHFTPEELPRHRGWGHASWPEVTAFAKQCGVGQLWLFHHKPGRTDHELARLERDACQAFRRTATAKEGTRFSI